MLPAPWVVHLLTRVSDALARLRRRMIPRHFAAVELATMSWVSQSVAAFCELRLPQALAHGPQTAAQLAASGYGQEQMLFRLLRSLAAYDVVNYQGGRGFSLGHIGQALAGSASAAPMVLFANAPWHVRAYTQLAQAVRTGRSGFQLEHGKELFEFLSADPEAGAVFDGAMEALTPLFADSLAHAYDFSRVRDVVDVGGGTGLLLTAVLRRFPALKGIVFELPSVVQRARRMDAGSDVASRLSFIEGDILTAAPPPAESYILSHVLHDWDDTSCLLMLRNVRASMRPQARLLIYELVEAPPGNRWTQDRITDLEMMAILTGKERTREEFAQLLAGADLRIERIIATTAPEAVIECVPAGSPAP